MPDIRSVLRSAVLSAGLLGWVGGIGWAGSLQPASPPAAPDRAALRARLDAGLRRLEPLVGEWEAAGMISPVRPDGSRDAQKGTWSNQRVLDGEHFELKLDVQADGGRVQYRCIASYNPLRERYETVRVGSSAYRFAEIGTFDASGRVLTLTSFQDRPGRPEPTKVDSVFRFHEDGTISVTTPAPIRQAGKRTRRSW